ncbi:hypothetical protein KOF85_001480 [Streptococcus mitis]|uniref:hypothetical protein n=1 Tax=Streptococcus mitis TaxID=28037 RepID=UPI001C1E9F51|nr:hypothetical protein [Streptococcus mitis]MBU6826261.1 hypothetical protein [Streptococcus mitis]
MSIKIFEIILKELEEFAKLKVAVKNFRKILKNSEIFLTGEEKGGRIGNIKKESRKRNE